MFKCANSTNRKRLLALLLTLCMLGNFFVTGIGSGIIAEASENALVSGSDIGEPQVVMTTDLPAGSEMFLHINFNDVVYIDWGNGNITTAAENGKVSGVLSGNTIKLYSPEDITLVYCSNKSLTALDVGNCAGLEYLSCAENKLTELDVSKNTALKRLWCDSNNLTALDVSNNTALDILYCSSNSLTALDVSNNTALVELNCENNSLSALDVSRNTVLERLYCDSNSLTTIDVSRNTVLERLSCNDNNLTALDVSNCAALGSLFCGNNSLTALDVSDCTALHDLGCYNNQLVSLDLSKNSNVISLECGNNALSTLNISGITYMDVFNCRNNNLAFSDITGAENINNYMHAYYMFQSDIEIPATIEANASIDLSSEYNIGGAITEYRWFYGDDNSVIRTDISASDVSCSDLIPDSLVEATPATVLNGVFTFDGRFVGEKLFCVLTNSNLPDLVLTTTVVEITEASAEYGEPQIVMTTKLEPGSEIEYFYITADNAVYVDLGDGRLVEYSRDAVTAGSEIKIYCNGTISSFSCASNEVTSLDLSNCPGLVELDCSANALTELDISNCTKLSSLSCYNNQITSLDASNCVDLSYASICLNNMRFSTMSTNLGQVTEYEYFSQRALPIPAEIEIGEPIDLSSEYNINDTITEYTWYLGEYIYNREDDSIVYNPTDKVIAAPTTSDGGVFTFGEEFAGQSLYCIMSNDLFPEILLGSTVCKVAETPSNEYGKLQVTMTTALPVGSTMKLHITANDTVYVDWGDGKIVEWTSDGKTAGDTIKLYCAGSITRLFCDSNQLTELDLSGNTALAELICSYNNLTKLDLSGNTALKDLRCDENNLIDLKVNAALTYLTCIYNELTELDVSECTELKTFSCEHNKLAKLDVTNCSQLVTLTCGYNHLNEGLLVSGCSQLKLLHCQNGALAGLDLTGCAALEGLWCSRNYGMDYLNISDCNKLKDILCDNCNIPELDLEDKSEVVWLACYGNELTELDVSDCEKIEKLECAGNRLKFSTITTSPQQILEMVTSEMYSVPIPAVLDINAEIDLSSEYDIEGTKTVYTWERYTDDGGEIITPTSSRNGVFTFGEEFLGELIYCTMTNEVFPNLTLNTSRAEVIGKVEINDETGENNDIEAGFDDEFTCVDENNNPVDVSGIKLIVGNVADNNKKTVKEAVEEYNDHFSADQNYYAMYDISLVDKESGTKVDIVEGKVKITIKVPDNFPRNNQDYTFSLYHYEEDGTVKKIPITLINGNSHFYFYADDFSPYILICTETIPFSENVPRLTVASAGYNSINLSWDDIDDADYYEVWCYSSSKKQYVLLGEVWDTAFTHTKRTFNTTYNYKIRAVSRYGEYSEYSEIVSAKTALSTPAAKAARSAYNSIKVSWANVSGASGYVIYRSTALDGTYTAIKAITKGSTVSYTNSGCTPGTTYYYKVRAFRLVGSKRVYGDYSEIVSAHSYLTKPTVTVAKKSYFLTVKWAKIGGATGYKVYRATDPDGEFTLIKTITSGTTVSMNNTSVVPGVTYYYKVVATRGSHESAESAVKYATPALGKPTSVLANRSGFDSIKITWTPVTGASGYVIYRCEITDGEYEEVARVAGNNTKSYNDTGLKTDKVYNYKVAAYRTVSGQTGLSALSAYDPGKATLGTVANVSAKRNGYDSVSLSWTQLTGADGYYIYRATSKSGTYTQLAKVEGGSTLSHIDEDLVTGKYYYYKLRGYITVDGEDVLSPSYSSVKTARGTLTTPVMTVAKVSSGKAKITVKPVDGADGYYVYRATSKNGTYTNITSKCIVTTDENGNTVFTIAGQTKGKTYFYKVRAYHVERSGNVYSSYCSCKSCKL